jgi:hypothetical protein
MNSEGKSDYERSPGHKDVPGFTFQQPFVPGESAKDTMPEKNEEMQAKMGRPQNRSNNENE